MKFTYLITFAVLLTILISCAMRSPSQAYSQTSSKSIPPIIASIPSIPESMPTPMPATSSSVPQREVAMILPPMKKKLPRKQEVIVIDPGHGDEDFGTHSNGTPKYHEKYLNLSTAKMLKNFLKNFGYRVVMTRNDDTFISLENRALFANNQNTRLFVSVHYNSAPSKDAEGVEVFFYRDEGNKSRASQSKMLAQAVLDKVIKNTKAKSRGVKHGNFAVIRETNMPAILIEGGFLTNEDEMNKLKNAAYLKSIALGIAQGIQDYLAKESVLAEK